MLTRRLAAADSCLVDLIRCNTLRAYVSWLDVSTFVSRSSNLIEDASMFARDLDGSFSHACTRSSNPVNNFFANPLPSV